MSEGGKLPFQTMGTPFYIVEVGLRGPGRMNGWKLRRQLGSATASASIPALSGYSVVWSDDFNGDHYTGVDLSKWNQIVGNPGDNGELEVYTSGTNNVHLSGDGQLYIVPILSGETWYSGRLESITSEACDSGGAMVFQAELWVHDFNGSPAEFAGLWPAFWALGEDKRSNGVPWPTCGEWDIFETADPRGNENHGTLHFTNADGSQNNGFSGGVAYAGGQYHTWAFKVDRRNSDWTKQALTWYLDGTAFYSWRLYTGDRIGTGSGYDSSMRVEYVAIYKTD
ncbi:glycoside hydrolase family 16 protein [Mycena galopus ATCC 62051]|nr:glycoside hydrolase family 16 protein [Mycena galopus ATCC 62051]